eukprot:867592-Pyramimonas_sp.AAC.1
MLIITIDIRLIVLIISTMMISIIIIIIIISGCTLCPSPPLPSNPHCLHGHSANWCPRWGEGRTRG